MLRVTANQSPHEINKISRRLRTVFSYAPVVGLASKPSRPLGMSVIMRVKNEKDWIEPSINSIKSIADEIIVADNGSTDGTYETIREMVSDVDGLIRLWKKPDLDHCSLSNFALGESTFRWIFKWDGDMVAHTSGENDISALRERLFSLDPRRHYLVYLRLINLVGDLFHQDPKEMVHIEEYIHTFSEGIRFVHPGRFEAVKFPKHYRPLFWYEPYIFHVNVKPAGRMLLRYFWEEWMEAKDFAKYPRLEDYVSERIEGEFGTTSWQEAQRRCVERSCRDLIRYDETAMAPYPELLEPHLENPGYLLEYEDGSIVGRREEY